MKRPRIQKLAAFLLSLCLCLTLCACSDQALTQIAQILLQEWASQQQQQQSPQESAIPELWTAPPAAASAKPTAKPASTATPQASEDARSVLRGESYTKPEDVAAYIHLYGGLPPNFITKAEAQSRGWDAAKGNLWKVAPGMSIGGDHFGNYEKRLPAASGRKWKECDVNYSGGHRGAERILYSTDGLVYYTADHYATFTRLY